MKSLLRDERGSLSGDHDTDMGEPAWFDMCQRVTPLVLTLMVIAVVVLKATGWAA